MTQERPPVEVDAQADTITTSVDDLDDLLAQGFEGVLAGEPAGSLPEGGEVPTLDMDDEDDLEDPDEGEDADADDADPEEEQEPEEPKAAKAERTRELTQDDLIRFGSLVAKNPASITQVPRRAQAQVIKSVVAAAYQRGVMDAAKDWQTRSIQEERLRVFVNEREQIQRDNPEAFLDWADANPEEAERFYNARRLFAAKSAQPAEVNEPTPEMIQAVANEQFQRLNVLPEEIKEKVVSRVRAGEFPATNQGLKSLSAAVDAAFMELATAAREPARRRAKAREEAVERRKNLARPIVSTGGSGADSNKIRDVTDIDELLSMVVS